jgi:putative MFS transporter
LRGDRGPAELGERDETPAPLDGYQKRLLAFLSVAALFEGYDFIALAQILPNFRHEMGVGQETAGRLVALVNLGAVLAYALVRSADRFGRRKVLTITIAGYAASTVLSGLAPGPWSFAFCQMVGRIFLIGEYNTSMVIAAEEFPASRRGMAIGVISACSSLGAIICAGLVPVLVKAPWGWRTVYFVSLLPLAFAAYARRGLKETRRFEEQGKPQESRSLFEIWKTPYRRRVLQVGAVWFVSYIATQNTVTFWKDYIVTEKHFTDGEVGAVIAVSAVAALPLVFFAGRFLDSVGRRLAAAVVLVVASLGTFGAYSLESKPSLTVALVLAIFASSTLLPVLSAFTTELFPTEHRADGFAWSNNLIGRIAYVTSPLVLGAFAEKIGWGPSIRATAIFPLIAVVLVYAFFPETNRKALEETAATVGTGS